MAYTAAYYNEDDHVLVLALNHNIVITKGLIKQLALTAVDRVNHPELGHSSTGTVEKSPIVVSAVCEEKQNIRRDDPNCGAIFLSNLIAKVVNSQHCSSLTAAFEEQRPFAAVIVFADCNYCFVGENRLAPFLHDNDQLHSLLTRIPVDKANVIRYLITATPGALAASQAALIKNHPSDATVLKDDAHVFLKDFHQLYCKFIVNLDWQVHKANESEARQPAPLNPPCVASDCCRSSWWGWWCPRLDKIHPVDGLADQTVMSDTSQVALLSGSVVDMTSSFSTAFPIS